MAWESRGRQRYFYRAKRIQGRVRKIYLGAWDVARQAAEKVAAAKARRAAERAELAAEQARLAGPDQVAAEVQHGVDLLTEAALLAAGCHEHRGEWRRSRNGAH